MRVLYHSEPEGMWAESPDIPGYYAAADTMAELQRRVFASIMEITNDETIVVESRDAL